MRKILNASLLFCVFASTSLWCQVDPYKKTNFLPERLEILPFGSVKPDGWIKKQIEENLDGFTGNLDKLVPELILNDDIYVKNRLSKNVKKKDVGALSDDGEWQVQFLWWNSETQSNWYDGYIRSAILADDKIHLERIQNYVNRILSSQDADGYLGIYDTGLRYAFDNENAELWAKTTLLRGLLAWYEYNRDERVLNAVRRAVQNTMEHYQVNASHPFYSTNENVGGLSHGLTFTDVLEELFRLTKDHVYLNYTLFLYKEFSEAKLNEDAQYVKLIDSEKPLNGHGVHTYEHLRSLAAAYRISGNTELLKALGNFEDKIKQETTATGGPVGDEWIGSKKADATTRGYEYCSLQELMHSYESLLAKSGNFQYGDRVEKIFFNAAQGARHPQQSSIAYLKTDNSYEMTGGLNGDHSDSKQTRYRYSPVHKEAAVCCVPNAGRIAPYYTQYMWMKAKNALVATLLGPSKVAVIVDGKPVSVIEKTTYPYGNTVDFEVTANSKFALKIRKPEWAKSFKLNVPYTMDRGFISVAKEWKGTETITLEFSPEVEVAQDINGEHYFKYGALVLAHSIAAKPEVTKKYSFGNFADVNYTAKDLVVYLYGKPSEITALGDLKFETKLYNPKRKKMEKVVLEPVGGTILRQVTFRGE